MLPTIRSGFSAAKPTAAC